MGAHSSTRPQPPLLAKLLTGAAENTDTARERILAAAIGQISDFGIRRFTVDELARRVGLSRVTIYRHFPSKDDILEAAVLHEVRSFMVGVGEVVSSYDRLDRRAVEGFVFALASLRRHAVLQRLLRTEPDVILPLLTTQGGPLIETGREFIAGFANDSPEAGQLALDPPKLGVLSEVLARMILSLVLTPESFAPLDTEAEIRTFADEYVGGIVRAFASTARG